MKRRGLVLDRRIEIGQGTVLLDGCIGCLRPHFVEISDIIYMLNLNFASHVLFLVTSLLLVASRWLVKVSVEAKDLGLDHVVRRGKASVVAHILRPGHLTLPIDATLAHNIVFAKVAPVERVDSVSMRHVLPHAILQSLHATHAHEQVPVGILLCELLFRLEELFSLVFSGVQLGSSRRLGSSHHCVRRSFS